MSETKKKVVAKKKVATKSKAGTKSTSKKKTASGKKVATKKKTGAKTKAGSKKKTTARKKVAVQTRAGTRGGAKKKTASRKKVAIEGKNENKSQVADQPTSSAKAVAPEEPEIRELSKVESVSDDLSRKTPGSPPVRRASGAPPVPVPSKHKSSLADGRQNVDRASVGPPRPPISAVPPRPPEDAGGRSKMDGGRARLSTPPPLPRGRIVEESSNPTDSSSSTVSEDARTVALNLAEESDFPDDSYSTQAMLSETTYTGLLTSDIEILDNESQDEQNEDSSDPTGDSGSGLRQALSQKMNELSKSPKKWKEAILAVFKSEDK